LEAIGKVDDACRRIDAVVEKYLPAAYMEYDGEVLDLGALGPNFDCAGYCEARPCYMDK